VTWAADLVVIRCAFDVVIEPNRLDIEEESVPDLVIRRKEVAIRVIDAILRGRKEMWYC
jgi:hypothetical protein